MGDGGSVRIDAVEKEPQMPQHTIGLLGTRIVHTGTDEAVHPSNFGPGEHDLLNEWQQYLDGVRTGGE